MIYEKDMAALLSILGFDFLLSTQKSAGVHYKQANLRSTTPWRLYSSFGSCQVLIVFILLGLTLHFEWKWCRGDVESENIDAVAQQLTHNCCDPKQFEVSTASFHIIALINTPKCKCLQHLIWQCTGTGDN